MILAGRVGRGAALLGGLALALLLGAWPFLPLAPLAVTHSIGHGVPSWQEAAAPSPMNYAQRFYDPDNDDRIMIRYAHPDSLDTAPINVGLDFTVEFSMLTRSAWLQNNVTVNCGAGGAGWISGDIIIDNDHINNSPQDYGIVLNEGAVAFGLSNSAGTGYTVCGTIQVDDGLPHHVAVTRDESTGEMCIYVDGTQDLCETGPTGDISYVAGTDCSQPNGDHCWNDPFLVIGAEKHGTPAFTSFPSYSGLIDELRISTVVRYTGNFTPPTGRLTTDANTVGLYHFDESTGGTVADASGVSTNWDQTGVTTVDAGVGPNGSPERVVSLMYTGDADLKLDLFLDWDDATGTSNAVLMDSANIEEGGIPWTRYTQTDDRYQVVADGGGKFTSYGYSNYFTTVTTGGFHIGIDPVEWQWPDVGTGEAQCRGGLFRYESDREMLNANLHGWFVAGTSQFSAPSAQYDWPGTTVLQMDTPFDENLPSAWFRIGIGPSDPDAIGFTLGGSPGYQIARETTLYFEAVSTPTGTLTASVTARVINPATNDTLAVSSGTTTAFPGNNVGEDLGALYIGNNQYANWGGGTDGELFNFAGVFVSRGRCPGPITAPGPNT